jgi:hypothetical protein
LTPREPRIDGGNTPDTNCFRGDMPAQRWLRILAPHRRPLGVVHANGRKARNWRARRKDTSRRKRRATMYRTFDEEVFLAPESIISGVLAASAFDEDLELPDVGPSALSWEADTGAEGTDADAQPDANGNPPAADPVRGGPSAGPGEAWSRHASAANGFGG